MKKMILLIMAGIALFIFIFVTAMLWYRFFYNDSTNTLDSVSSIEVKLDKENNTINETGLIPLDEESAKNLTPYSFEVKNTSDASANYNVIIEDAVISDDENYSSKELLSRNQLEYQLSLNGRVIKKGMLSEINNNILDTRNISANTVNNYQLRVYVSETVQDTSWQNKYYHFDVKVQMEVE